MVDTPQQPPLPRPPTLAKQQELIDKLIRLDRKIESLALYVGSNAKALEGTSAFLEPRLAGANLTDAELTTLIGLVDATQASTEKTIIADAESKTKEFERLLQGLAKSIGR